MVVNNPSCDVKVVDDIVFDEAYNIGGFDLLEGDSFCPLWEVIGYDEYEL